MKNSSFDDLVKFFFEVGTLRKLARSHRQALLTDDLSDNIASHSFRTAIIGYFLARQERVNPEKVVLMCLFHDTEESRTGDQNWIHKKYVKIDEDEVTKDQLKNLDKEIYNIAVEYNERKSKEAKIAKDADLLDQILLLKEYESMGNKEASLWLLEDGKSEQEKRLFSDTAKKLAKKIKKSDIHCWWEDLWTEKRKK